MPSSQRARSGVPLDKRSALASVPGVPAWGAVAITVGASFLGFVVDAVRGTELTTVFACFYLVGVVAAAVLVYYRGLFTAMVQAPLILFAAVPLAYQFFTDNPGTTLKDILLNVAIPLVNRFPLMLLGTILALAIGGARIFLKKRASHSPANDAARSVRDRAKQARPGTPRSRDREPKGREPKSREPKNREPQSRDRGKATRSDAGDFLPRTAESSQRGRRNERTASNEGRRSRRDSADEPRQDRQPADLHRAGRDSAPEKPRPSASRPIATPRVDAARRPAPRPPATRVPRAPDADQYAAPRASVREPHIPPHPVPQVRYRDRLEP